MSVVCRLGSQDCFLIFCSLVKVSLNKLSMYTLKEIYFAFVVFVVAYALSIYSVSCSFLVFVVLFSLNLAFLSCNNVMDSEELKIDLHCDFITLRQLYQLQLTVSLLQFF